MTWAMRFTQLWATEASDQTVISGLRRGVLSVVERVDGPTVLAVSETSQRTSNQQA